MSEHEVNITIKKTKSIAPLILGPVGFVLNIPNLFCALICAGAAKGGEEMLKAGTSMPGQYPLTMEEQAIRDSALSNAAVGSGTAGTNFAILLLLWILLFVLSFFGTSKLSKYTGILMILLSVGMIVMCCLNFSPLGLCGATCYLIAAIISIVNAKR